MSVTGTIRGALEIEVNDDTSGVLALEAIVEITSPLATELTMSGDGDYSTSGAQIALMANPACVAEAPIDMGEFTATSAELTLWANVSVFGLPFPTRMHFVRPD